MSDYKMNPVAFAPEIMSKVRGVCSCGKTNFSLVMDALQGKNDECKYCGDKNYITKEEPKYTIDQLKDFRVFCKVILGVESTKEQEKWFNSDNEVRFK